MALDIDALSNTRAVEYEVRTPEDADGMFDILTYQKGGSVVRMLEQWLGIRRVPRRCAPLPRPLPAREHRDHRSVGRARGTRPTSRRAASWTRGSSSPGSPRSPCEPDGDGVRLTQRRFRYDGADATEQWSIPMLVRACDRVRRRPKPVLLDDDTTTIPHDAARCAVVLNAGGEGFYRVAYPPGVARRDSSRAGADAARALRRSSTTRGPAVVAGHACRPPSSSTSRARLDDETDVVVWRALVARLRNLTRLVDGDALDALRVRRSARSCARRSPARAGTRRADEGPA